VDRHAAESVFYTRTQLSRCNGEHQQAFSRDPSPRCRPDLIQIKGRERNKREVLHFVALSV